MNYLIYNIFQFFTHKCDPFLH